MTRMVGRHRGTGVGLPISRRLCELMGGAMWLESEEGVGSTFHFTVRVQATSDEAPPAPGLAADRPRREPAPRRRSGRSWPGTTPSTSA